MRASDNKVIDGCLRVFVWKNSCKVAILMPRITQLCTVSCRGIFKIILGKITLVNIFGHLNFFFQILDKVSGYFG